MLVDILKEVHNGRAAQPDIKKSIEILSNAKESVSEQRSCVLLKIEMIGIHTKPVRNFLKALKRLLNSTLIDFSRMMQTSPEVFDLFDSMSKESLSREKLTFCSGLLLSALEDNWIAFNQCYGRMLIKLKMTGCDFG